MFNIFQAAVVRVSGWGVGQWAVNTVLGFVLASVTTIYTERGATGGY